MRHFLFFFGATRVHRDLQHHHNAVNAVKTKPVKTAPITRPSKRKLAGSSNQIRARIAVEKELEAQAQALLQSEAIGPHNELESEEESDLEVRARFREQKGRLHEEIKARGHKVIFDPKFHCELNPIEPYWCKAKCCIQEHYSHSLEELRQTVPKALAFS